MHNPPMNFSNYNSFVECVFLGNIYLNNTLNSGFYNSIIQGTVYYSTNNHFLNCIFPRNGGSTSSPVLLSIHNNELLNNIFITIGNYVLSTYSSYSSTGNVLRNNLIVTGTPNYGVDYIGLNPAKRDSFSTNSI